MTAATINELHRDRIWKLTQALISVIRDLQEPMETPKMGGVLLEMAENEIEYRLDQLRINETL
jgi:hypothetical protein